MSESRDINDILKKLEKEISSAEVKHVESQNLDRLREVLKAYSEPDRIISSEDIEARIKNAPDELKIMSTWPGLDSILHGFRLGQVVTIAAPTKSGKTSFCMDLTTKIRQYNPLWFPFEEGADELVMKYLERGESIPKFFVPGEMKGNLLPWIEDRIIESIAKYNTQVVFIDHLHFIVPFASERQDLRIGETMRGLKGLAKRWKVVIFLIAHLKKTRLETQPDLEDLRDSSFIAQESDTVILLWRETKREGGQVIITNNTNLSVQANRRTGKTGNVKLSFFDGKFLEGGWSSASVEEAPQQVDGILF